MFCARILKSFLIGGVILSLSSLLVFNSKYFFSYLPEKSSDNKDSIKKTAKLKKSDLEKEIVEIKQQLPINASFQYDEDIWGETEKGREAYRKRTEYRWRKMWHTRGYV